MQTFEEYVRSLQLDPANLSDSQKITLQAAWRATQNPAPTPPPLPTNPPAPTQNGDGFAAELAAVQRENARISEINKLALETMLANKGNVAKCEQIEKLRAAAVDGKTDVRDFRLSMIQTDRHSGPFFYSPAKPQMTDEVIEAALCVSSRLPNVEKQYSEQTLQAAHSTFRRGIGLKEFLMVAAERNSGVRPQLNDDVTLLRAAAGQMHGGAFQGSGGAGPSTISVSGILSNVANKHIVAGFMFTEQTWRRIARIRPVSDFKTHTGYRLYGATAFEEIAPTGEIKHGTLGNASYTNRAKDYGKMLGFGRQDLRNDDLGALTGGAMELGRGGGTKLNSMFWAEFLDDASFFSTGNSNLTTDTALAVLNLDGLNNAYVKFKTQTKEDGTPLGAEPRILLCATGQEATALSLTNSMLVNGLSSAVTPNANVWVGRFQVASSTYLHASLATLWYLLADPNDIPVIEVVFLDGRDTPVIETTEFDFDRLGMAMRAYFAFGCRKQEYRGGQKANGEAS